MTALSLQDLPEFYQSLKGGSVLIVGNGPSASQSDLGQEIDRFDTVVRINNYVTKGLESKVGSRTDIWVNGANQGLKKRQDLASNILVLIPSVVLDHKGQDIHKRIQHRLGSTQYFMLPVEVMKDMERECGLSRPTTGFFSIYFIVFLMILD